jgi:hypothetical protein
MDEAQKTKDFWSATWKVLRFKSLESKPSRVDPNDDCTFQDCAWKRFNAPQVISALLSPGESYFAHKEVLFAALCAHVVAPGVAGLRKASIAVTAAKLMVQAEQRALKEFDGNGSLADAYLRLHGYGYDFLDQIYHPVGGLRTMMAAPSPKHLRTELAEASKDIPYAITIMKVHHHHVVNLLPEKKFGRPSINKSGALVSKLGLHEPKHRQTAVGGAQRMEEYWKKHRATIALLYAASDIYTSSGSRLLDALMTGTARYGSHKRYIPEWIGKAAYAAEEILSKLSEPKTAQINRAMLPLINSVPITEPDFTDEQRERIRKKYRPGSKDD